MNGIIHPPKAASVHPPSPVKGYGCHNCPGFRGLDPQNIQSRMGTCGFEPAKVMGSVGSGQVLVQWTPTHPEWWCLQHPVIKAAVMIAGHQEAARLLEGMPANLDTAGQEKAE